MSRRFTTAQRRTIHTSYLGLCHLCDLPVTLTKMTVDHIIPLSQDGPDTMENCAPAHGKCNNERGSMSVTEYRRKLYLRFKPLGVTKMTVI